VQFAPYMVAGLVESTLVSVFFWIPTKDDDLSTKIREALAKLATPNRHEKQEPVTECKAVRTNLSFSIETESSTSDTFIHVLHSLSCIITGGPAPTLRSVNEVSPKKWRILMKNDAISMTTGP
jgi:hypothetical protein